MIQKENKPVITKASNGNIFSILAAASAALKANKLNLYVPKMRDRVRKSDSYAEALSIIQEYVEFEI